MCIFRQAEGSSRDEEALLAIHEAEPIIVDSPDFVGGQSKFPISRQLQTAGAGSK